MRGKLWRIVKKCVGILVIVLLVLLIVGLFVRLEDGLSPLGFGAYTVLSGSMRPDIAPGSLLLVERVPPELVQVGDVLTFRVGGSVVSHRVVDIEETADGYQYITKGDANDETDRSPVLARQVIGRRRTHIPGVGLLLTTYRSAVIAVLVGLIALRLLLGVFLNPRQKRTGAK